MVAKVIAVLLSVALFLTIAVAAKYFAMMFSACLDATGTWNGLRYMCDYRYRTFAVLNYAYAVAPLTKEDGYDKFVQYFSRTVMSPLRRVMPCNVSERERQLLVMLLSQEDFVKENFRSYPYPYTVRLHKKILRKWEEHLKRTPCEVS